MKKIYLILLIIPLLLQSCLKHQPSFFDENASERVTQALRHANEVLKGATNGWIMSYYPGWGPITPGNAQRQWGGFTLLMKFEEDDMVTMRSLHGRRWVDSTATSLYQLIPETGPILSFNTFNPLIHYFTHPRNPDGINSGAGNVGMNGDNEFIIMSAEPDKVVLRSKKRGNTIIMRPFKEEMTWGEYLAKIRALESEMLWLTRRYFYIDGNDTISVRRGSRLMRNSRIFEFTFPPENLEGEPRIVTRAFVSDLNGIVFYEPIELFGKTITRMNFDIVNEMLVVPDQTGKIVPYYAALSVLFADDEWFFQYSDMGTASQASWRQTMNDPRLAGRRLHVFSIHPPQPPNIRTHTLDFIVPFAPDVDGGRFTLTYCHFGVEVIILGTDRIRVRFDESSWGQSSGWYWRNGFQPLILRFAPFDTGTTYTLTADDERAPNWVRLQDVSNANNWYRLHIDWVEFPFEN
jgi:hypothetical protein